MTASATFTRLSRDELAGLVSAAQSDDPQDLFAYLAANGTSVADFDYDAEIFSTLLPVLAEDFDIDLETGENEIVADIAEAAEVLVVILTQEEQTKYLAKLDPDNFDEDELAELFEDFSGEEASDAGEAMLAGIATLAQALSETDADHVVVVTAG
jgi:hypothetical protein